MNKETSSKVSGDIKNKFSISFDRNVDNYFTMFVDKEMNTTNYFMSKDSGIIEGLLLNLYINGNSAIKLILGSFVTKVVAIETKKNYDIESIREVSSDEILKNQQIN